MKKAFTAFILILLCANLVKAQKRDIVEYQQNYENQKTAWGFYLGLNKKDFNITYKNGNAQILTTANIGFNVGLIGEIRLHKNLTLRLEPGISSNTKKLAFTHISGGKRDSIREINATYLRIPLLLKFSANRLNNIRPYVIGGASYDYNFSSNQDNPNDNSSGEFRMKKQNFMYEMGIGVDLYLPYFVFSPSIRGVFAINNELVKDTDANSPWTGSVDYFGTRGIFLKLAFH